MMNTVQGLTVIYDTSMNIYYMVSACFKDGSHIECPCFLYPASTYNSLFNFLSIFYMTTHKRILLAWLTSEIIQQFEHNFKLLFFKEGCALFSSILLGKQLCWRSSHTVHERSKSLNALNRLVPLVYPIGKSWDFNFFRLCIADHTISSSGSPLVVAPPLAVVHL